MTTVHEGLCMQNSLVLTIVIITWNCRELLIRCLESIYPRLNTVEFEIIIVDNKSVDGTVQQLERDYPEIHLIKNNVNRGVATARNQGIRLARGRYILILDADTEIISQNVADLIQFMDANKNIGLIGCSMLTGDGKPYASARTLPSPRHVIMRRLAYYGFLLDSELLKKHHLESRDITHPTIVGYVIGAFQLIRKECADIVGLLDEEMFYGYEDADYCARMKKAGFEVVFFPNFLIKHYVQAVTRKNIFSKLMYEQLRSYVKFYIKHRDLIGKEKTGEYV